MEERQRVACFKAVCVDRALRTTLGPDVCIFLFCNCCGRQLSFGSETNSTSPCPSPTAVVGPQSGMLTRGTNFHFLRRSRGPRREAFVQNLTGVSFGRFTILFGSLDLIFSCFHWPFMNVIILDV